MAVKRVGKRKKSSEVAEWVEAMAQQAPVALDLLGRYILALTRGVDPATEYWAARQALGYEAPDPEGVADAGGPKSAG